MNHWEEILTDRLPAEHTASGNRLALHTDGDASFRALWSAIDEARERVWMEFYIFEDDRVGRQTRAVLERAAERGCDVVLLYDAFGSISLPRTYFDRLRRLGACVLAYNPFLPFRRLSRRLGSPSHRDHRKTAVIDGSVGFTGGLNVSEEYAGEELGIDRFWDVLVRVDGPAVHHLANAFRDSVEEAAGLRLPLSAETAPAGDAGDTVVQVLGIDALRGRDPLDRAIRQAVRKARERCFVTTPYFVPPEWLTGELIAAAARGVDVRLLTAGRSDIPLARMAGRHLYGRLLRGGVRIYEMTTQMLHAKYLTVDGQFASVGSYNFDRWSDRHNLEANLAVADADFTGQLNDAFITNLLRSREVTLTEWQHRALYRRPAQWLAYRLART